MKWRRWPALRKWSLDSQLAAPSSRTRLTGCGMEMSTSRSRRRGEGSGGEGRRGEERPRGGDTLIRKHPHLWRGDRGLCRRQCASAVMASWPHGLTAEGGWMLGRWAVLDVERGFGATGCHLESWSPGQRTGQRPPGWNRGKLGVGPDKQMHTAHAHCTLTAH